MEENNSIQFQNKELLEKNKELTLQNNNLQLSLNSQKEEYSKLEKEIKKKDEELEGLRAVIFKLNSQLEMKDDIVVQLKKKNAFGPEALSQDYRKSNLIQQKNSNLINKTNENQNEGYIKNIINQLNDAEKKISILQNKNRELQFKLDEKQVQKEMSGYRTEDNNISNYEEEFDLKKMVNGARDKIRSEDINIDYPGVQGIKDKYRELLQNMNMLEEQIKILICNINCNNNKIKPQIRQICQLMRIPAKKIELIIAGKDKKKALGILD
jgi:predicted nuclease with TOPRIM domain